MSVIPFGIVGAIIGHILMGANISIMSMCGIVALSGVVVNDSLVLVDYVNRHRIRGKSIVEAAWEAGAARFRPIILTSLTTFAGLSPMLFETDVQAKFLIPMAISLGFGILFATFITLILVPCVYLLLEDLKSLIFRLEFDMLFFLDSSIKNPPPNEMPKVSPIRIIFATFSKKFKLSFVVVSLTISIDLIFFK